MKPILFSTPMVQAVLAGRKTQTRRLIKEAAGWDSNWKVSPIDEEHLDGVQRYEMSCGTQYSLPWFKSKYQPGDILYVRETWQVVRYAPPGSSQLQDLYVFKADTTDFGEYEITKWKPSLFMPKAAARIFLQVTDVRAERLQDITEENAIAEGVESFLEHNGRLYRDYSIDPEDNEGHNYFRNQIHSFKSLWDSINKKTSPWENNDWVWVYSFEKIQKP